MFGNSFKTRISSTFIFQKHFFQTFQGLFGLCFLFNNFLTSSKKYKKPDESFLISCFANSLTNGRTDRVSSQNASTSGVSKMQKTSQFSHRDIHKQFLGSNKKFQTNAKTENSLRNAKKRVHCLKKKHIRHGDKKTCYFAVK